MFVFKNTQFCEKRSCITSSISISGSRNCLMFFLLSHIPGPDRTTLFHATLGWSIENNGGTQLLSCLPFYVDFKSNWEYLS